jgi:multisubunit Na+/H+ antiporter MnhB subunit
MVLSCFDLLVVLTNHPLAALRAMLFLTGKFDDYHGWAGISSRLATFFVAFSSLALLVMNFDRYLATYYPIFHRTSVTKKKLLTLLAILITVEITLLLITFNDFVIRYQVGLLIIIIIIFPQCFS